MSRAGNKKRAGKQVHHKHKSPYESRGSRKPGKRDDYDRVWAYDEAAEQASWDEAQEEALRASADRFDRDHTEDVP